MEDTRNLLYKGKIRGSGDATLRGKWIVGYVIHEEFDHTDIPYIGYVDCDRFVGEDVEPETVSRYIGISDINGTMIFMNDIIHIGDKNILYKIVWSNENQQFMGESFNGYRSRIGLKYWEDRIVVVGNIFDNPELLSQ